MLCVNVNTQTILSNAQRIKSQTDVLLLPVIKASAYGAGAIRIATALREVADGFCVFGLAEAAATDLGNSANKKPILALGPLQSRNPDDYLCRRVTPCVSSIEEARLMKRARPALCVDVGMRRFACPAEDVSAALAAGDIEQVFAHATSLAQVDRFIEILGDARDSLFCHVAGSSLLSQPAAYLDAVRPGLALYEDAINIETAIVEVHGGDLPAGYSQFRVPAHGIILAGYLHGLRPGPCLVNHRPSRIIEVGMQTSFVETSPADQVGDRVTLLSSKLTAQTIAQAWKCSPQEVMVQLLRTYKPV